jgi:peptide-methionine (S)-S-oxide reductase
MKTERAILAGGCFWGMQELIRKHPGVTATRVGYSGGDVKNATYRNHGTHAEAIEIIFDPEKLSFRRLLEFFFQVHDPTTPNRQGNDRGASYRSGIYYTSEAQREVAEDTIDEVNASGLWPGKVVTELKPAGDFWEAEPEHQDYLRRFPDGYTCHFVRLPEGLLMIKFLLWMLLFVLCWPLALLALVLWPLLWLVSLPFRLVGIAFEGVFELLRAIFLLPSRLLGSRHAR